MGFLLLFVLKLYEMFHVDALGVGFEYLLAFSDYKNFYRSSTSLPKFLFFSKYTYTTYIIFPMKYLIHFLITAAVIYYIPKYIPGIQVDTFAASIIFAIFLAALNLVFGTILRIITFPLRLLTLGLFGFVIWGILIYVADQLVPGVTITGIVPLAILTVVLTCLSFVLKLLW